MKASTAQEKDMRQGEQDELKQTGQKGIDGIKV